MIPPAPLGFPYPLVTVHGRDALATWERLRREGKGWPVVLGGDDELPFLIEGIEEIDGRSPEAIIAAAADFAFPASLVAFRAEEDRRAREWLRENGHDEDLTDETPEPPLGEWPGAVQAAGFTIATEILSNKPIERIHIALLPCATGWEAMAHLRWGGWNENPSAEVHVAALRAWHERFGAELVGVNHDTVNLRVARRPDSRDAALALAREQYLYCNDIVDQGTETLSALAATLMADDWWYFWWD